jgi:type IV pilus assembly protein PilB
MTLNTPQEVEKIHISRLLKKDDGRIIFCYNKNFMTQDDKRGGDASQDELRDDSQENSIPMLDMVEVEDLDLDDVALIPEGMAKKNRMVVVGREENVVRIGVEDPNNIQALNALRFLARKEGVEFEVFRVHKSVIDSVIDLYESAEEVVEDVVKTFQSEKDRLEEQKTKKGESMGSGIASTYQDAPVTKLVEVVIRHAIDGKASDIHIEPIESEYRVRFRVDGILHSSLSLPKEVGQAVVARIKILANLKIDEKRKPQDGRFRMEVGDKRIDFRVSTLPVIEGEKVVMRLLDKDGGLSDLKSLGLMGKNFEIFNRRIHDPYGIILITGPTGSGKSTTLYGFLRILNQVKTNIITLEDPVEYFLEGINQSQVRPEIGYTFASGLRSILRQDPNVIMVGEIRDAETAELSIHAALTGHLVFSTLHTNTSIGAIPRLLDMGIEGFLLASSLRVVAAQRLVRRICEHCKEEQKIESSFEGKVRESLASVKAKDLEEYGIDISKKLTFYKGRGCKECGDTGYKGRLAIYEVLEVGEEISSMISGSSLTDVAIEKQAQKQGMLFMKQDGFLKALQGYTTIEEIERVTEGRVSVGGDMSDDVG